MLKVSIISEYNWLEDLLRQQDIEIVAQDLADLVIEDDLLHINLLLTKSKQVWQLPKPVMINSIFEMIRQVEQKLQAYVFHIGPIDFYPEQRLCKLAEEQISLTQKEAEIISCLLKKESEVDKQTLLHEVWGYSSEVSTRTLETHIYNLRNKFLGKYDLISSNHLGYIINIK